MLRGSVLNCGDILKLIFMREREREYTYIHVIEIVFKNDDVMSHVTTLPLCKFQVNLLPIVLPRIDYRSVDLYLI